MVPEAFRYCAASGWPRRSNGRGVCVARDVRHRRLALDFGALWLVPLAWGATSSVAESGALMAGYYGGALTGSMVAITVFEGPWAGPLGWAAGTALLAAPGAVVRAGRVGSQFPRAGTPLRYLIA